MLIRSTGAAALACCVASLAAAPVSADVTPPCNTDLAGEF